MRRTALTGSQRAVFDALRDQPDLVEIATLARYLRRHPNTLREHLAPLLDAGLIVRHAAPSEGQGRPRWLYGVAAKKVDESAEFVADLAWLVAHREHDPVAAGREAARQWAGELVERLGLVRCGTARAAREQVVAALRELGYAPHPDGRIDRVQLKRCPLLQVASVVPEAACTVHLTVIAELLDASGGDPRRVTLKPFASRGICALRLLAPPAAAPTGGNTPSSARRSAQLTDAPQEPRCPRAAVC